MAEEWVRDAQVESPEVREVGVGDCFNAISCNFRILIKVKIT